MSEEGDMSFVRSLPYQSRSSSAAAALRRAIAAAELKPGERLIELALAEHFRIGQPTLREALKELEYQGLVHRVPNRGTYVTELSFDDLRKIHQIRMVLEPVAFKLAAKNMTAEAEKNLAAIVDAMEEAANKVDRIGFHTQDIEFHRTVWRLSGNEYFEMALERFVFAMFAFVLSKQGRDEFLAAVDQHRKSLAALVSGDPKRARRAYIEATAEFWKNHYRIE